MNEMKKVIRYECPWCGKLFKTPNRHQCKFDPANRNCLSCRHCGAFGRSIEEDWERDFECVGDGLFRPREVVTMGFRCERDGTDVGEGGFNDFPVAVSLLHQGRGCRDWEMLPDYTGTKSFAKHQNEVNATAGGAK